MVSIIKQIFYLVSHLIECAPGGLSSLYLRGLSIQFLKVFASFSLVYCFTLTTPCLNNFSITKYIIAFNYANVVAINLFLRDNWAFSFYKNSWIMLLYAPRLHLSANHGCCHTDRLGVDVELSIDKSNKSLNHLLRRRRLLFSIVLRV